MSKIQQATRYHRLEAWKKIITQCRTSGLCASEYIRQNNISEGKYYYWLRIIREDLVNQMPNSISAPQKSASNQKTTFAPVPLQQIQPIAQDKEFPKKSLMLYCDKFQIEVTEDTSCKLLEMTIAALQAVSK